MSDTNENMNISNNNVILKDMLTINNRLSSFASHISKIEKAAEDTLVRLDKLCDIVEENSEKLNRIEQTQDKWEKLYDLEVKIKSTEQRLKAIEEQLRSKEIRLDNIEKRVHHEEMKKQ